MDHIDPKVRLFIVIAIWIAAGVAAAIWLRRWRERERARERVWAEDDAFAKAKADEGDVETHGFLRRWLFLAGFRTRSAPTTFVIATAAMCVIGLLVAFSIVQSGFVAARLEEAASVPGGIGDLARPILAAGPWIFVVMCGMLPWTIVNGRRKKRVREIEQDLPVTLELFATMSESGLAFDTALEKLLESSDGKRPLFQELRQFRAESLGGVGRVQCFRRFAKRIEVAAVSVFVSALVQADQVGAGFTRVLRIQADDLRNRRREDANMLAEALTVKLVFPLVICFLPGIFVTTLGPTFLAFIKLAGNLTKSG